MELTTTHNLISKSLKLSERAESILIYILSKPNNWILYHQQIAYAMNKTNEYITKGMRELVNKGYAERVRLRKPDGKWDGYKYTLKKMDNKEVKAEELLKNKSETD